MHPLIFHSVFLSLSFLAIRKAMGFNYIGKVGHVFPNDLIKRWRRTEGAG